MLDTLSQKQIEHRHGCILTVSHAIHRRIKCAKSIDTANWGELKRVLIVLIEHLNDQQPLLSVAAIKGVSLVGSVTILPLPNSSASSPANAQTYDPDEQMDIEGDIVSPEHTKSTLAKTVLRLLRSAHSRPKIREEAAICLGYLAIGDGQYFTQGNLNAFIKMVKLTKDATLNIAIAQSIVFTTLGHATGDNNNSSDPVNPYCDDATLDKFLNSIIRMVADPSPASRNATAVWLLALVKNCSARKSIYANKQTLQYAFTELLSDDSDFVQDVASRGLGLVFAISDPNHQSDLANSLLEQLLGGKRQVNQVNADTQLFAGELGKTPTGYAFFHSEINNDHGQQVISDFNFFLQWQHYNV